MYHDYVGPSGVFADYIYVANVLMFQRGVRDGNILIAATDTRIVAAILVVFEIVFLGY